MTTKPSKERSFDLDTDDFDPETHEFMVSLRGKSPSEIIGILFDRGSKGELPPELQTKVDNLVVAAQELPSRIAENVTAAVRESLFKGPIPKEVTQAVMGICNRLAAKVKQLANSPNIDNIVFEFYKDTIDIDGNDIVLRLQPKTYPDGRIIVNSNAELKNKILPVYNRIEGCSVEPHPKSSAGLTVRLDATIFEELQYDNETPIQLTD